jgi:hypothetical protein
MFLSDALKLSTHSRSNLKIHVHQSPSSQKDWTERWPDPAASETIQQIEQLRADSSPLASLTTIRATPATSSESGGGWSVPPAYRGFWMHLEETPEGSSRIKIRDLPRPGAEAKQSGYLILLLNEAWIGPIRRYLESEMVHRWVDHHAERRGNRWNLNEQLIKFIPVPQALTEALNAGELPPAGVAPFWESVAQELAYQPKKALESLSRISHDESGKKTASYLFVKAAKVHEQVRGSQARLLSLVKPDGRIDWRSLLMILPKEECIPAAIHHDVRLSGTLPPHIAISRKEKVKSPVTGILLTTESGFNLRLDCSNSKILDMIWSQIEDLTHPTWSELAGYIKLPKQIELAEATANDVLMSHGDQISKLNHLSEIMNACLKF